MSMKKTVCILMVLLGIFMAAAGMAALNVYPGSTVTFGYYEQDGNRNNGPEEIEWQVVSCDDDVIVMISKYGLDCVPFHEYKGGATWENCTLRYWLNTVFLNSAFTPSQQDMLYTVEIANPENPKFGTYAGGRTQDKVFIPSVQDLEMGFNSFSMQASPTRYAIANGAHDNDKGKCWWWLRTPGKNIERTTHVTYEGTIYSEGTSSTGKSGTVRPCVAVNRNKL